MVKLTLIGQTEGKRRRERERRGERQRETDSSLPNKLTMRIVRKHY